MKLTEDKLRKIVREEIVKEEATVNTPRYDLTVYNNENNNLVMSVSDGHSGKHVLEVVLGKRGGQKLMDALTYHL